LRQNQRRVLRKAKGRAVLLVKGPGEEKCILDKEYFEALLREHASVAETLQILANPRLYQQILAAAGTLEEDLRLGRLHSLDEAFGEE